MKTTFNVSHMEENSIIRDHFQDRAGKLQKYLKRYKDELVYLHGTLDKNPHKTEFFATLSLYLPSATLHCRERAGVYALALNLAFLDIARQLEKHKDKLSREKRRSVR
ncbi:MAG: hypothetical protein COY78_06890 [Candidatus Omnitrophica bacterium CG_4_10_14_0_8_um_filter_44_12]|nr:MAG: hypothetical protein COY78_06890 [Candidatus Omnitrophica bacterium CG_4_10_14_0_8_um_filter_44_12]